MTLETGGEFFGWSLAKMRRHALPFQHAEFQPLDSPELIDAEQRSEGAITSDTYLTWLAAMLRPRAPASEIGT